jgi:hypothetical protein
MNSCITKIFCFTDQKINYDMHIYVLHIKREIPLERTPLLSGHNFGNHGCPLKREYT